MIERILDRNKITSVDIKNKSQKLILITIAAVIVLGGLSHGVLADHTSTAELEPEWSPAGQNVEYTVTIFNDVNSPDAVGQVRIYKNSEYSDFECDEKSGWILSEPAPGICNYYAYPQETYKIPPGDSETFTFSATTPDSGCEWTWQFETRDITFPDPGSIIYLEDTTSVDDSEPTISKEIVGEKEGPCPPGEGEECWITQDTELKINITEEGECGISGLDWCEVTYTLDGSDPIEEVYEDLDGELEWSHDFTFDEDSLHVLNVTCKDIAGNILTDIENFRVDTGKPETSKEFEGPQKIEGGVEWIDSVTNVTFIPTDPDYTGEGCNVGVEETYYVNVVTDPYEQEVCYNPAKCNANDIQIVGDIKTKEDGGWSTYNEPFKKSQEGCHVLEYYSVDELGNEEDIQYNCFFVDKHAPYMEKDNGDAILDTGEVAFQTPDNPDGDFHWKTTTNPITFTCDDTKDSNGDPIVYQEGSPLEQELYHMSEGEELCFKVSYDYVETSPNVYDWGYITDQYCTAEDLVTLDEEGYGGDWCCVPVDESTKEYEFFFQEESMHNLEYFCRDAVEKSTDVHTQYYKVDNTAPEITKTMLGAQGEDWIGDCPPESLNDECFVVGGSGVNVDVEDGEQDPANSGICKSNEVECTYTLFWLTDETTCNDEGYDWQESSGYCIINSEPYGDVNSTPPFDIIFNEDSEHELYINCRDALGNEVVDVERFKVDQEPPTTTKEYGDPTLIQGDYRWIDTDSLITLTAADEKSDVDFIEYRWTLLENLDDESCIEMCDDSNLQYATKEFTTVDGNTAEFSIPEDSCHLIEFKATDNLGNVEDLNWQCVFVDDTPPMGHKWIGESTIIELDTDSEAEKMYAVKVENPGEGGLFDLVYKGLKENGDWEDVTNGDVCVAISEDISYYFDPYWGGCDGLNGNGCGPDMPGQTWEEWLLAHPDWMDWYVTDTECFDLSPGDEIPGLSWNDGKITLPDQELPENGYAWAVIKLKFNNGGRYGFSLDSEPDLDIKHEGMPEDYNIWVQDQTPVELTCEDLEPHPSEHEEVCFKIIKNESDVTEEYCPELLEEEYCCLDEGTTITFDEDAEYDLEYYCRDYFGNENALDIEHFIVNSETFTVNKSLHEPYYGDCPPEPGVVTDSCYVDTDTSITLDIIDTGSIFGVQGVECRWRYRKWNDLPNGPVQEIVPDWSDWQDYDSEITFPEECYHELEIECEDSLGNIWNDIEWFVVDKTPPKTIKDYEGPQYPEDINEGFEYTTEEGYISHSGPLFNFVNELGWEQLEFKKYYDSNCNLIVEIDMPRYLGESPDNFDLVFDDDADNTPDFLVHWYSDMSKDPQGDSHWTYKEYDGSWSSNQELPNWIQATPNSKGDKFYVTLNGEDLGGCGSSYRIALQAILSDQGNTVPGEPGNSNNQVNIIFPDEGNNYLNFGSSLNYLEEIAGTPYPHWVTSDTEIYLEAFDQEPHPSGVLKTFYREIYLQNEEDWDYCFNNCENWIEEQYDGEPVPPDPLTPETYGWTEWTGTPFHVTPESCHIIEYYSVDNVEKVGDINWQCVFVDDTSPEPIKTVDKPSKEWHPVDPDDTPGHPDATYFYPEIVNKCWSGDSNSIDCWKVTKGTNIYLDCEDPEPHPVNNEEVCFKVGVDAQDGTDYYCEEYNGDYNKYGDGYCCVDNMANAQCIGGLVEVFEITEGSGSSSGGGGGCLLGEIPNEEHNFVFRFLEDTEHNLKYYCVDALGNKGPEDDEKFKVEGDAFNIHLNKKWNLISFPFALMDSNPDEVFKDVSEEVISVWTFDATEGPNGMWHTYTPDGDSTNDDIDEIKAGNGYWVLTNNEADLLVGGALFSPTVTPPNKEITKGWNLIGYYGTEGLENYNGPDGEGKPAYCALFSLINTNLGYQRWSSLVSFWEEAQNPWIEYDIDDNLDPGAGYWVEVDVDDLYTYATTCGPNNLLQQLE